MPLQRTVIVGKITIEIETFNIDEIEIYIDNDLKYPGKETKWIFDEKSLGKHEIKAIGYRGERTCEDKIDVFMLNVGWR